MIHNHCYCSVATSCLTLCDPTDCRTSGFPVLTAAAQASLSFTVSQSLFKLMSMKKISYSHRPRNDKEGEMADKGCKAASA